MNLFSTNIDIVPKEEFFHGRAKKPSGYRSGLRNFKKWLTRSRYSLDLTTLFRSLFLYNIFYVTFFLEKSFFFYLCFFLFQDNDGCCIRKVRFGSRRRISGRQLVSFGQGKLTRGLLGPRRPLMMRFLLSILRRLWEPAARDADEL